MRRLRELILRLGGLFNKQRKDRELDEEIESHLQLHIEENVRLGMTPEQARREAMIKLGGVESMKEAYRDQRGLPLLETLWQDIRYGGRMLRKNPGFTAVAVLTLAIGIGANTSIFTMINTLLFKTIQARSPRELVGVFQQEVKNPGNFRSHSYPDYLDIRASREVFEDVLAFCMSSVAVQDRELTREVRADVVSANFFSVLGVAPLYGRGFFPEEEWSPTPVAVLSYPFWKSLGGDPGIIGSTLRLTRGDVTVVGVMPEGFTGTMMSAPAIFLPFGLLETIYTSSNRERAPIRTSRNQRQFAVVGRLKSGLERGSLSAALSVASARLEGADPVENKGWSVACRPLSRFAFSNRPDSFSSEAAPVAALALGLSVVVLIVACLNLANMMLARGATRRKEIAVRLAMGAGRRRILRQLLAEGFLLALIGGAAGLLLSLWGIAGLRAWLTARITNEIISFNVSPDIRVFGTLLAFSALATVFFALGPAWKLARMDVTADLKEQAGADVAAGQGRVFQVRNLLAVGQIAFSLALLTIAFLFMRSAANAVAIQPGFEMSTLFYAEIKPALADYDEVRSRELMRQATERIGAMPGVQSASAAGFVPLRGSRWMGIVQPAGAPPPSDAGGGKEVWMTYNTVGTGYFRTLGVPLLRGRDFEAAEVNGTNAPAVAIISANLAEKLWPGEDPVGRQIQLPSNNSTPLKVMEVVGVVPSIAWELFEKERPTYLYVPFGQDFSRNFNLHVRIVPGFDSALAMTQVRDELHRLDPRLPVTEIKTVRTAHEQGMNVTTAQIGAMLFGAFGVAALLLSVIGVYGLRAYAVACRTREIGIRMALGASSRDVLRLVLKEGIVLGLIGLGVGLFLGALAGRLSSSFLYQVGALDPLTFIAAPILLGLAILLACVVPAARAAKVEPMEALRYE